MAKPFPVFADNHIRQPIVDALRKASWDVVRAVDLFGERNNDEVIFRHAAEQGRVFLSNDRTPLASRRSRLQWSPPFEPEAHFLPTLGLTQQRLNGLGRRFTDTRRVSMRTP